MSTIDKLNSDASMLDIKNTLQQINEYQSSTNNRLYTVLQNQNIESTVDMTLNELISATDEGFSNIISNKNTKIDELETQVTDLNSQLEGKVTPAGDAVASNVLSGKTFINSTGQTITGTMTNRGGAQTITPGTSNKTLYSGYYSGNITVKGDSNLKAANIKSGTSIFGVTGTYTGGQTVSAGTANILALAGQANSMRTITMDTYSYYEIFKWTSYVSGTVTIKVYGRASNANVTVYYKKNNTSASSASAAISATTLSYNMTVAVGDVVCVQVYTTTSNRTYYDGYVQISIA